MILSYALFSAVCLATDRGELYSQSMGRAQIGQVLRRMGKLNEMDIEEILVQQNVSRQRFGEIALQWGLCEPPHLCEAWMRQITESAGKADLMAVGVDPRAVEDFPADVARRLEVIPIRSMGDQLIIAAARILSAAEMLEVLRWAGKEVRLVLAAEAQIQAAIEQYYPAGETIIAA
jgi:hypothetical protein